MIQLFNRINSLDQTLNTLKESGSVGDYRLYLSLNNDLSVYVIRGTKSKEELINELELSDEDIFEINSQEEVESDYFLKGIYNNQSTININDTRRRMSQFFSPSIKMNTSFPVVTFYSYKGGVGRSTALASCATYLAYHFSRKVVILDCDFEAPGFTNFFLEDPTSPINKEGLVEYFIDEEKKANTNLSRYYWQASKLFSGNGEIYVFPAGNLNDSEHIDGYFSTHRAHYLNGLTRIDMFSPNVLAGQFEKLFTQIKKEINPDIVLIDSRTGFNDIFGLSAFRLSDMVVGFFGNNIQSMPGLNFFLEILEQESAPRLLLVNSIIPATHRYDRVQSFSEYVTNYLEQLSIPMETDERDAQLTVETFYISSNDILNNVGTFQEDYRDFLNLIQNTAFADYNILFNRIDEILREKTNKVSRDVEKTSSKIDEKKALNKNPKVSELFKIKKTILTNLKENMPKLYADTIASYSDEYRENRYFYRNCMEDLFNPNKILIIGNKGTGKTYIYRSLKEKEIVEELKNRANKTGNYLFIQAVDATKRFDTIKFDNSELNALDYERFWTVYIWNTIMLEKPLGFESSLKTFSISDDTTTCGEFLSAIKDTERIKAIEQELNALDAFLSEKKNIKIIILFDELDKIVNPIRWSERISPLINFCRKMSYRTIFTKLFVRSDLYDKTSNLNNKNELKNRSITIEWNREELFAFFFKHLFSHSKNEFFDLLRKYDVFPSRYITKIEKDLEKNHNQLPLDTNILRQLCRVFFGEYADVNNNPRFGESYDWFFKNLQNSNGTLSLRPFIDLISISVEQALEEDKNDKPILSSYFYTMGKNRAKAVEHHFEDLASDSGNEELRPIIEYIRDHASIRYKRDKLMQKDFFALLDSIILNVELTTNNDRDSIIRFLEINGIISQSHIRIYGEAHKMYTFALLYKYYLGLKSKLRKRL
jgi:cellulose biosynthesis protein BcsQ